MEWISVNEKQPELEDKLILVHFENGSIETIHIEDWFGQITNGKDADGNQKYTQWFKTASPTITHWMPLPEPPKV